MINIYILSEPVMDFYKYKEIITVDSNNKCKISVDTEKNILYYLIKHKCMSACRIARVYMFQNFNVY